MTSPGNLYPRATGLSNSSNQKKLVLTDDIVKKWVRAIFDKLINNYSNIFQTLLLGLCLAEAIRAIIKNQSTFYSKLYLMVTQYGNDCSTDAVSVVFDAKITNGQLPE